LAATSRSEPARPGKDVVSVQQAADALRQAQVFLSDVTGPPESDDEQQRLTSTLHALDHASRLAEAAGEGIDFAAVAGGPDDKRAGELCAEAMRSAATVAGDVAKLLGAADTLAAPAVSTDEALVQLKRCATDLAELRRTHRSATLGAVANGTLTADAAIVRVDTVRSLEALAHHAWRSTAHLMGRGE
jgi:phosphate:Na+ symporter